MESSRSSASPHFSRTAPMKVKKGIDKSRSLETMPNSWYVRLPRKSGCKSSTSIPRKPKNRPAAASENAAGKPTSMHKIIPPNISGACCRGGSSLQGLLVHELGLERAGQRCHAFDQLGQALQGHQGKADRQHQL